MPDDLFRFIDRTPTPSQHHKQRQTHKIGKVIRSSTPADIKKIFIALENYRGNCATDFLCYSHTYPPISKNY